MNLLRAVGQSSKSPYPRKHPDSRNHPSSPSPLRRQLCFWPREFLSRCCRNPSCKRVSYSKGSEEEWPSEGVSAGRVGQERGRSPFLFEKSDPPVHSKAKVHIPLPLTHSFPDRVPKKQVGRSRHGPVHCSEIKHVKTVVSCPIFSNRKSNQVSFLILSAPNQGAGSMRHVFRNLRENEA